MKKLIAVLFLAVSLPAFSQNIHVTVTGVENSKGKLMLGVFTSNENFKEEKLDKKTNLLIFSGAATVAAVVFVILGL